jgi:prophage regulatory protein
MKQTTPPASLRPKEAAAYLGIARATLYRYVEAGIIEPPRQIGPGAVAWRREDLDDWLESRPVRETPA